MLLLFGIPQIPSRGSFCRSALPFWFPCKITHRRPQGYRNKVRVAVTWWPPREPTLSQLPSPSLIQKPLPPHPPPLPDIGYTHPIFNVWRDLPQLEELDQFFFFLTARPALPATSRFHVWFCIFVRRQLQGSYIRVYVCMTRSARGLARRSVG